MIIGMYGVLKNVYDIQKCIKNVNEITKVVIICTVHCVDDNEYNL